MRLQRILISLRSTCVHRPYVDSRERQMALKYTLLPQGNNQQEQDKIRTFKQGLIHPDVVARAKMFFLPPSVVALLVMFSR